MNAEETVLLVGFMTVSACLIIGTVFCHCRPESQCATRCAICNWGISIHLCNLAILLLFVYSCADILSNPDKLEAS